MKILLFLVLVILTNPLMAKENLVFAVIGDYGANSLAEAKVASVLKSKIPSLFLLLEIIIKLTVAGKRLIRMWVNIITNT
ncbi:hypothetical protein PGH43_02145 [Legionella pneumophila 130b]|nr:hypothetical protein PGH43_02145 [Legionella pneumophila 130b]WBV66340.1 hypothetical protein PGH44_02115 [Legionella pneumophila]